MERIEDSFFICWVSHQRLDNESGMFSNLCPIRRVISLAWTQKGNTTKREYSPSVCILGYILQFVVLPDALINIKKGLMVMNKPCSCR